MDLLEDLWEELKVANLAVDSEDQQINDYTMEFQNSKMRNKVSN